MSWRRVALLVALGASSAMAWTRPGKWVAWELLDPLRPLRHMCFPLTLELVGEPASRGVELIRACKDLCAEIDDPERVPVTPEAVAERLSRLDGWSTAVLYDFALGPGALYEAGLDIETCGRIVGPHWCRPASDGFDLASFPVAHRHLVLLDAQGRCVGHVVMSRLRPGWALETDADYYVPCPSAPGDGPLPAVCIFRRGADGEVARD